MDAVELGAVRELAAERETRFNVGFDCATIFSSPVPCCTLFDIASGQLAELTTLILNKWRRLFHSVCELVFGCHTFELDLWVQVD